MRANLLGLGMLALVATSALAQTGAAPPTPADAIVGTWLLDTGEDRVHVEIVRGDIGYDARIVWIENPVFAADDPRGRGGQLKVDWNNPDAALRDRPIVGITLVEGIEYDAGTKQWGEGRIYAPDQGRTYRCTMRLDPTGVLRVRGYVKIGFIKIGRTIEWVRVD